MRHPTLHMKVGGIDNMGKRQQPLPKQQIVIGGIVIRMVIFVEDLG